MYLKINTDCNYVGCHEEHLVQVPDDITEEEKIALADEFMADDIGPTSDYEEIDDEEAERLVEEEGYEVELRLFENVNEKE